MFIPVGDDNSARTRPPRVVWALFGLNVGVWALQLVLGERFTYGFSTVPAEITGGVDLVEPQLMSVAGAGDVLIPQAPGPSPIQLTLLSAMFMHGSWMHIIGNMAYLLIFGDQIEDLFGRLRFTLFFLACGISAGCAHILAGPQSVVPSLGASGAIAGVLGAYLLRFPTNPVYVLYFRGVAALPAALVLGGWLLLQFVGQITPTGTAGGVAYMAHLGGFVTGLLLTLFFAPRKRRRRDLRREGG